ncbi:MAG: hypothetical protein SV760_09015, partial [Halobacteria archaeon]|nr:hypothetical protein [Halobacteria archaeon]
MSDTNDGGTDTKSEAIPDGIGGVNEEVSETPSEAEEATATSIAPSRGFTTLVRREVLRYIRRPRNTFMPPLITNVLYFSVFGVIL